MAPPEYNLKALQFQLSC